MSNFTNDIIEAVKKFEADNPGVFIIRIDFDRYGNLVEQMNGDFTRLDYKFEIEAVGREVSKAGGKK